MLAMEFCNFILHAFVALNALVVSIAFTAEAPKHFRFGRSEHMRCTGTAYTDKAAIGCNGWGRISEVECQQKCSNVESSPNCPPATSCMASVYYAGSGWCHLYTPAECQKLVPAPDATTFKKTQKGVFDNPVMNDVKRAVTSPLGKKVLEAGAVAAAVGAAAGGVAAAVAMNTKRGKNTSAPSPIPDPTHKPNTQSVPQASTTLLHKKPSQPTTPQSSSSTSSANAATGVSCGGNKAGSCVACMPSEKGNANMCAAFCNGECACDASFQCTSKVTTTLSQFDNMLSTTLPTISSVPSTKPPTPIPGVQTFLIRPHTAGSTSLDVADQSIYKVGDVLMLDYQTPIEEEIGVVGFSSILTKTPLRFNHASGALLTKKDIGGASSSVSSSSGANLFVGLLVPMFLCCCCIGCIYKMATKRRKRAVAEDDDYEDSHYEDSRYEEGDYEDSRHEESRYLDAAD
jgi:hypothetical protein